MKMGNRNLGKLKPEDYYYKGGYVVLTEAYHLKRGYCCGNGCLHCPFSPRHVKGSKK